MATGRRYGGARPLERVAGTGIASGVPRDLDDLEARQDAHPETLVLTENTGHARNYNRDPYGSYNPRGGYYSGDSTLFPNMAESERFGKKDVVIGARTGDGAVAFRKSALRRAGLMEGTLAGSAVVAVYDPVLDTGYVYRGKADDLTVEDGTVTLAGTEYAPDTVPRERVLAFDAMWFAWYAYYPDTSVHA